MGPGEAEGVTWLGRWGQLRRWGRAVKDHMPGDHRSLVCSVCGAVPGYLCMDTEMGFTGCREGLGDPVKGHFHGARSGDSAVTTYFRDLILKSKMRLREIN